MGLGNEACCCAAVELSIFINCNTVAHQVCVSCEDFDAFSFAAGTCLPVDLGCVQSASIIKLLCH